MSTSRRPGPSVRARVWEIKGATRVAREDRLGTEEPLEIRVAEPGVMARRVAVTMRTPGHDFELAAGWLVHEQVTSPADIDTVRYCTDVELSEQERFNVVTVGLSAPAGPLPQARLIGSACGVCGAESVADVPLPSYGGQRVLVDAAVLRALPDRLRERQAGFERTGALHAAGLYDPESGEIVAVREDVGRHNAVDKVVGCRLLERLPVPRVLVLSGRIGFELIQKATISGIQIVVAVGAPTSLAVSLAERAGLTVVGFTSPQRCVVYAAPDRVS